jgi:uncharacterized membrane protein YhaH (DUF805 family)
MSLKELLRPERRLSRLDFFIGNVVIWLFFIIPILWFLILQTLPSFKTGINFIDIISVLIAIIYIVLSLKVSIWRLHDLEKNWRYALLWLVPLINIILGYVLLFKKGTKGKNIYWVDPEIYSKESYSFNISESINTGWKFTKKYFWTILKFSAVAYLPSLIAQLITAAMTAIPGASELVMNPTTNMQEPQLIGIYATISIVISVIWSLGSAWLGIGAVKSFLMILEDKKPLIKDLCVPSLYLVRLIGAGLLVGIAILLGLVHFIIPGIYIAVRLSQYKYFIAEWYDIMTSIKGSRAITQGNVWKLIWVGFLYVGVVILWVIALLIGLLRAIPTITLAQAWIYTQLKKNLEYSIDSNNYWLKTSTIILVSIWGMMLIWLLVSFLFYIINTIAQ